jgi:hypothetical protein
LWVPHRDRPDPAYGAACTAALISSKLTCTPGFSETQA